MVLEEVPARASVAALVAGEGLDVVVHDIDVVLQVALAPVCCPAEVAHVVLGLLVDRLDVVPQVTRVVRPGTVKSCFLGKELSGIIVTLT